MAVAVRELDNALSVVRVRRQTPPFLRPGNKEDRIIGERLVPSIEIPGDAVFLECLDARGGGDDIVVIRDPAAALTVAGRKSPEAEAL